MRSFAELPGELERLLRDDVARVLVVLLDAFGSRFLERYGDDHPFLRRLLAEGHVRQVRTQFPSTTTAHVTTMHLGQPVGRHGLYEWNVYEPSLDRVITPLRFSFAGDPEPDTLKRAGFTIRDLLPDEPTLYERLRGAGLPSIVHQPAHFSPSTFDSGAIRGADLRPYADLRDGLAAAARAAASLERGYVYLYFDGIDATGHVCGPSSREFDDTVRFALDALEQALFGPAAPRLPDTLLIVTADHGQVDVDPEATLYLDELWPPLSDLLAHRPAGSARDVFLHVAAGRVPEVMEGLRSAVGDRAEVHDARELMATCGMCGPLGERLRARLADVCVLPGPGRMAWLRSAPDLQRLFRGHHGGLAEAETRTHVSTLRLG